MKEKEIKLIKVKNNPQSRDVSKIFSFDRPPLSILKQISSAEFEDLTYGWVMEYLLKKGGYVDAVQIGEGRDSGRDIIAYLTEDKEKFDIFQCKRYTATSISPSVFFCEFAKLCYYTYIGAYNIPQKYILMANKSMGNDLRYFFEHKNKIAEKLIEKWDDWCKDKITTEGVELTEELKTYILSFNFNIIDEVSPGLFLEQLRQTRYYKYYFGGGMEKRECIKDIDKLRSEDDSLPFVKQLYRVYSYETKKQIDDIEKLKREIKYCGHFFRQYNSYLNYLSLVRFARDQLLDDNESIKDFLEQIYYSIADVYELSQCSLFERVLKSTEAATNANISIEELGEIRVQDKIGACHELVNIEKIRWIDE